MHTSTLMVANHTVTSLKFHNSKHQCKHVQKLSRKKVTQNLLYNYSNTYKNYKNISNHF